MNFQYRLDVVPHLIAQATPEWAAADIHAVSFLPGGYSNANFRFTYKDEDYVARIPAHKQPYVDRTLERQWYAQLRRIDPDQTMFLQPVALDTTTGVMVTHWVEGELLVDYAATQNQKQLLEQIGQYAHRLHQMLPQTDRVYSVAALIKDYAPEHAQAVSLAEKIQSDITSDLAEEEHLPFALSLQSCHNDLNPWNIVVTASGWITLDWEFYGRNTALFDIVTLHQGLGLAQSDMGPLLQSYSPGVTVPQSEIDLAMITFWLREWAWAHYQLRIGNDRTEIVEQEQLARSFLEPHWS